ncbi:MAG: hypothetical protein KKF46_07725 [Nanoarchaeota archaeon]|nr:hypothetical protein [Nanoarchaeota archaeon]MBU1322217.1 hypothetical protein [Nanoarchaeota archaeon]MBU1597758.1 hypothetical protein [Nanoarchaeota archaeon]MBU2442022.1 hypothetical protein [Nanoarchaeota archaeon]
MKKTMIITITICLIALFLIVGCKEEADNDNEPVACTADAKVCPDGSAVGRDPDNNCEFPACPENVETETPEQPIVGGDKDEHGCIGSAGYTWCEAKQKCLRTWEEACEKEQEQAEKKYEHTNPEICDYVEIKCPEGEIPFFDDNGCGCEPGEPELDKHFCIREKDAGPYACTMEFRPVCGWANKNIQCIKYPCASTFSNPCTACVDENVEYWTEGECPE